MQIAVDAPVPHWDCFEFALESADPLVQSFYDTVTGEVHVTGPFEDDPGERERIDADPRRYREIGHLRPGEAFGWMGSFVEEEITDERLRGLLLRNSYDWRVRFTLLDSATVEFRDNRRSYFNERIIFDPLRQRSLELRLDYQLPSLR